MTSTPVAARPVTAQRPALPPPGTPSRSCTIAAPSTAPATIRPAFTGAERLALAGFLAGYRGLAKEAYTLDLRQFTTWCRARSLSLFAVRRADIDCVADLTDPGGLAELGRVIAEAEPDLLVNNAGFAGYREFREADPRVISIWSPCTSWPSGRVAVRLTPPVRPRQPPARD